MVTPGLFSFVISSLWGDNLSVQNPLPPLPSLLSCASLVDLYPSHLFFDGGQIMLFLILSSFVYLVLSTVRKKLYMFISMAS